jgi:hypothetical protein
MARYSLNVYDNITTTHKIIKLRENGKLKEKVDLTTIDNFLLDSSVNGFADRSEFHDYLNNHGFILTDSYATYITYQENGNERKLETLYGEQPVLKYLATVFEDLKDEYSQKVHNEENKEKVYSKLENDEVWNAFYQVFLKAIKNGKFNRYFKESGHCVPYLYEYIDNYTRNLSMSNHEEMEAVVLAEFNVKRMLKSYKYVRDVQLAFNEYNQKFGYTYGLDNKTVKQHYKQLLNNQEENHMIYEYDEEEKKSFDNPELNPLDVWSLEDLKDIMNNDDYQELVEKQMRKGK